MRCSCHLQRRRTEQIAQADQVVGDHVQAEHRSHLFAAAQLELAQPTPLLDPAVDAVERSSYTFSMPRRALIDLAYPLWRVVRPSMA
jgi:hypothetical protein